MVTPLEMQKKEFSKSFRGYNIEEVDDFFDRIFINYEKVCLENVELKDKIMYLNDQIERYKDLEETLKSTLLVAQTAADETTKNSKDKAEMIIENAKMKAEEELKKAEGRVQFINFEYNQIKKEFYVFKNRYLSFLESQKALVQEFNEEIKRDANRNYKEKLESDDNIEA